MLAHNTRKLNTVTTIMKELYVACTYEKELKSLHVGESKWCGNLCMIFKRKVLHLNVTTYELKGTQNMYTVIIIAVKPLINRHNCTIIMMSFVDSAHNVKIQILASLARDCLLETPQRNAMEHNQTHFHIQLDII